MVLSKRERIIGLSTGGVLALLVLDHFAISPLFARRTQLEADTQTIEVERNRADQLFASSPRMNQRWKEMVASGLKSEITEAQSQGMRALYAWAHEAGVAVTSLQPDPVERSAKQKDFQQLSFRLSGTGPMRAMSRLLWSAQTARIPMRVTTFDLASRKEGTDDLTVNLTVSTLCLAPATGTTAAVPGAAGGSIAPPRPTPSAPAGREVRR